MHELQTLDPVQISDGVWNMTPGMSNSYLVVGTNAALLIDTGVGRDDLLKQIIKMTDKSVMLVTTHAHGDHTGGHHLFGAFYIAEADVQFLPDELKSKAHTYESLKDNKFNLGDGETAEFIPIPGHTPGSYAVFVPSRRLMFTGDMICNGSIFMVEGQCDFEAFIESMNKIAAYSGSVDYLVTCHGEPNMLPVSHTAKQISTAKAFLSGELKGVAVEAPFSGTTYVTAEGLGFFRP